MSTPSDDLIERATVREVAGVFHSRRDLEATVEALQLAGFDRADIDTLSNLDQVSKPTGPVYVASDKLPAIPQPSGQPVIMSDDVAAARMVVTGALGTICAVATVSWVVASGGGSAAAVLAAMLAGGAAGGIGYTVTPRFLRDDRTVSPEGLPAGFLLLVRVRSPDREQTAQQILRDHDADAIRAREVEIEERPDDIPLSSLRPDPWLGDDRLGQP
jgi:hypothetical protein